MDRRKFLTHIVGATAGLGLANATTVAVHKLAETNPSGNRMARYKVKGFTCVTCATGLEVMLRDLKGVVEAHASYPERTAIIGFDQNQTSEQAIKDFIESCGFVID